MADHRYAFSGFLICMMSVLTGLSAAGAAEGGIVWEEKTLSIDPAPQATSARGKFTFTNTGEAPVNIRNIKTTCGCTAAEAGGAGRDGRYAPGGKGEIEVTMSFSRGDGIVRKGIYVTFDRDGETFVEKLTVEVNAKIYAKLDPSLMVWRLDQTEPGAKTARLEVQHTSPINVVKVKEIGDKGFEVDWRPLEKGRRYEVSVKPVDVGEQKTVTIRIITDFPSRDDPLTYDLRATVRPKAAPRSGRSGIITALLSTPQGIMALAGATLAALGGAITIMMIRRRPQKEPHAHEDARK